MSVTDGSITVAEEAEQTVRIVGTVTATPSGTQTVAGTVTANQGTPAVTANAWPVEFSDGVSTVNIGLPGPNLGAGMVTTTGTLVSATTLDAVTTDANGATMDTGSGHANCTVVGVGTDTLTGTITIEGSVDDTTFVSTGATVALTAAATVTATSSAKAFRYYRASLSDAGGTGTLTAKIMAS